MEHLKELRAHLRGRVIACNEFLNDVRNAELYPNMYTKTLGEVHGYKKTIELINQRLEDENQTTQR